MSFTVVFEADHAEMLRTAFQLPASEATGWSRNDLQTVIFSPGTKQLLYRLQYRKVWPRVQLKGMQIARWTISPVRPWVVLRSPERDSGPVPHPISFATGSSGGSPIVRCRAKGYPTLSAEDKAVLCNRVPNLACIRLFDP